MKLLFAASEALPFVKVGGLGDVIGALPKVLAQKGHDVRVVIPFYSCIDERLKAECEFLLHFSVGLSWRNCYCGVFTAMVEGVRYYLLDNLQYFDRGAPYGEYDDAERFAFFSKAVLEMLPHLDFFPDIIHANDWHTGLIPVYLKTHYAFREEYAAIKTVFSIHNIEFQGKYDSAILEDVLGIDRQHLSLLHYDYGINFMKGGIETADFVTTVSESYAHELFSPTVSFGLHHILWLRQEKFCGIVNGIDTVFFDPETDRHLAANYSVETIGSKIENKRFLQRQLGLPEREDVPLIGMVTRLTDQKGFDLLEKILPELFVMEPQLVILGTGDPRYEELLRNLESRFPEQGRGAVLYSEAIAQQIYGGADLFLMPSRFEPCGLAQMIAMRYGTIPIVHKVGGLKDTVYPYSPESGEGNGITFESYDAYDFLDAVRRGIDLWKTEYHRNRLIQNAMAGDYSWQNSAEKYLLVYDTLLNDKK